MHGFITTLKGLSFDSALARTIEAKQAEPDIGLLPPRKLAGRGEIRPVAAAAPSHLRRAHTSTGGA
ncbi:hypothetical protein [Piscinibacter sp.]|jgi:hypothetical protein|uniref:hypothetical protein n=1 Tax=Piscinibacter sp. TaxID=1903157 RepID=UPI001B62418F|nr:hypothetical protein [Piscinibacter sp.]MBK7529810.1 hypothetical protein [Piscinibacter sp.]MBP6544636.1 hypothetical protein [Piscinibacter sp.]